MLRIFKFRPGRTCAFCNLGERSVFGQGDLVKIETSKEFTPFELYTLIKGQFNSEDHSLSEHVSFSVKSARRQKGAAGNIK